MATHTYEHSAVLSRTTTILLAALLTLSAFQATIGQAQTTGTTINVDTTDDELNNNGDCSLREAIQAANTDASVDACPAGGDEDEIILPAGIYTLTIAGRGDDENETGDLDISDGTLAILGSGAENTVISGDGDRVIHVVGQEVVLTIQGITITGGKCEGDGCGEGGGINGGNHLTISNSIISNNHADRGGGLYLGGTVTITNTTIIGNNAFDYGGGLVVDVNDSVVTIASSSIYGNSAGNFGGGITVFGAPTFIVRESSISGNVATRGGGIHVAYLQTGGSVSLASSTISYNSAGQGGGIHIRELTYSSVSLADTVISDNVSSAEGGGIYLEAETPGAVGYSPVTLANCMLSENSAYSGGGIFSTSTSLTLEGCTVSNNSASYGGGIASSGDIVTLSNSVFWGNDATYNGGGIYVDPGTSGGTLTVSNSTLSGNRADIGGGIYTDISGLDIAASTFDSNIAFSTGGGIFNNVSGAVLRNSIVANSVGTNCSGEEIVDDGNNLQFGDAEADSCGTSIPIADPKLGPLADNGGPTLTHALLPGSAAIDAGDNTNCPATDQRGVSRPLDGDGDTVTACDIGAFEFENTPAGSNVVVRLEDAATGAMTVELTYAQVAQPGTTSLTTSGSGPAIPGGFGLGNPPTYYDIITTAVFTSPVTVCVSYTPEQYSDENNLRLLHHESDAWIDVTTSNDTANHIICGQADSLSPFVVAEQLLTYYFTGFFQPVDNLPTLNVVNAGRAIPVKFSLGGDQGLDIFAAGYPASAVVTCGSTAEDAIEETVTAGSSSLSYDASTDTYTYVWKTNKSWTGTCRTLVVKLDNGSYHYANFKFK